MKFLAIVDFGCSAVHAGGYVMTEYIQANICEGLTINSILKLQPLYANVHFRTHYW